MEQIIRAAATATGSMTRQELRKFRVPERCIDGLLDALAQERAREVGREGLRLSMLTVKDVMGELPEQARKAVHTHLMTLTPELAARLAQCSRRTIDRARASGQIRYTTGVKGLVTIDGESFLRWKHARRPEMPTLASDV